MAATMRIDFVSDVSCPWCVIGLKGLEQALDRVGDLVAADIHFQPFELNPDMPDEGQNLVEHITQKYGITAAQSAANRAAIVDRAAGLGFTMTMSDDRRIYNTFDAHRLLHWAGLEGRQRELKVALFEAYFTQGQSPGDHAILLEAARNHRQTLPPERREPWVCRTVAAHSRNPGSWRRAQIRCFASRAAAAGSTSGRG